MTKIYVMIDRLLFRSLLLIGFIVFTSQNIFSEKSDRSLFLSAQNALTRENISCDKLLITFQKIGDNKIDTCSTYSVNPPLLQMLVPRSGGNYLINISSEGYLSYKDTIRIKPLRKMEFERTLSPFYLSRQPKTHKLSEAVVRASKVKFFYRGDTLVYDADAFNTAGGSMLEALIKQLPGVNLKPNGEITVNGKPVDDLLLSGERFFNGNRQLMLENLPAYVVKDVRVYDKEGDLSAIKGRDVDAKRYVMDVKLKKEYAIGLIGNIEAGKGSKERYLGRIFGMRYSDCSRLTLVSNLNNLNDSRKPGEDSYWTPEIMPKGLLATKMGGFDYLVKEKQEKYKFEGNITASHTDADNYKETTSETYLPTGDWFRKSSSQSYDKFFAIQSSHVMKYELDNKITFLFKPDMSYQNYDYRSNGISATFLDNPSIYYKEGILDTIAEAKGSSFLRQLAINRYIFQSKLKGHSANLSTPLEIYNVNLCGEDVDFYVGFNYKSSLSNTYNEKLIDYPNQSALSPDYRNRYIHDTPNRSLSYYIGLGQYLTLARDLKFIWRYNFSQEEITHNYEYNLLSRLEGWNEYGKQVLGVLPSEVDFKIRTMDAENSYNQHQTGTTHSISPSFSYKGKPWVNISLPVSFQHQRLNYFRGNETITIYNGITRHNFILFNPSLQAHYSILTKKHWIYPELVYQMIQQTPEMTSLLNLENTSDPLNIYHGNPSLKKSSSHNVTLTTMIRQNKTNNTLTITPTYFITQNAIAYGYTYNKLSGKRNYYPQNVNGNYQVGMDITYGFAIDKKKQLTLTTSTHGHYQHGVDLFSPDDASESVRSSVGTWRSTERLVLNYRIGKNTLGAKGYMGLGHTTSARIGFESVTLCDFNYGLTGLFALPFGFQLSTDITMYSRRGYVDKQANTNDLVWNARLSKQIPKTNLTLLFDGFDILHNLSNRVYSMDSQGRSDTYYNALPRYVMFHVIYRFTKQPKKKN